MQTVGVGVSLRHAVHHHSPDLTVLTTFSFPDDIGSTGKNLNFL
jgi:hypothetical protein